MVYYCTIGGSTELQFKVNTGSYELPLFKPPLCKVTDAESDVSTSNACIEPLCIIHSSTYVCMCMCVCTCVCVCVCSVQNNSLSQNIFRRKTLFVSAYLYLYGNNIWMKL